MGRLILCATFLAFVVVSFAHTHSHEAPHLKYSREVNEAAARGEDIVENHGHSHGGYDDHDHRHHDGHDHHSHTHEHHGHLHHDDHDHDHEHDYHHVHDHHDHHGHDHEHQHVVSDLQFSETGPLAFLNDPKQRFWTFSIGSTILISLFPCFILTFIPINSNEDENSSNKLKVLLALGAGGLLGDAFLHLIPHAQMAHGDGHGHTHSHSHSHASGEAHEPHDLSVGGWVLGGFFIFFVVEKFVRIVRGDEGHGHSHGPAKPKDETTPAKKTKSSDTDLTDDDEDHHEQHRAAIEAARLQVAAYLNLIADFMHNFTDGLAIGASFVAGEKVGIITMITVLIHEIPHEIGDFAILVQSGYSKRKAMLIQLLTALGALAGCIIACLSSDPFSLAEQAQSSWVLPFTAGGFIYIAAVSVIPELLEKSSLLLSIAEVFAMTLGMPNVISLQVGQCGNQLGQAFLAELCQRHGIGPDGVAEEKELDRRDLKDVFFYESDSNKYIYRCVLADLEPRVLTKVQNSEYGSVYNSENVYTASQGGGAGNAWASGYGQGREAMEAVMEIIQKEAEASDWLECFMLTHSVSGGTGSGMGSKLLESVRDCYPKKLLQAYSVFPVKGESNVVVEPYNAVLTTSRLAEYADLVMVVDNKALNQVAVGSGMEQASFDTMNNMVAQMMGIATAPQRFGSTSCPTFLQQVAELSPFGAMHFIGTALFPFNIPGRPVIAPKTTSADTLRRLLQPKSLMISATTQGPEYMISGQAIFEGAKEDIDVFRLKMDVRSKYRDLFPSWHGLGIRCLHAPPSPYMKRDHRVSGLLLANHTRFLNVLDEMVDGYDKLYAKNAYINQYEKQYGIDFINEMGESRNKIETLREVYREVVDGTFMTPKPMKREGSSIQSSSENVNVA